MESKMFVIFVACFGLIDTNIIRGPQIRPSDRACSRYKAQYQELALKAQYSNWLKITGPPKNTRPSRVSFLDNSINNEKPTIVFRIIGEVADEDEFPHMAAVGWSRVISPYKPSYQYLCGGTLISESFILTAAHCKFANNHKSRGLKSPEPNVVKLGQNYLNMPSLVIEIEAIIPHELYKSPNKYNDIALFRLKDKVEFSLNVMPACLSGKMVAKGVATGWGATQSGRLLKSQSTNNLHKATVDIVDPKLCNDVLANHNWLYGLADHQICAGDLDMKGRDTCQGDSGSPLQYKRDQDPLYYILGVTSFGSKNCGQHPAVYTRVSSFLPWIESIVWPAATVRNDIPSELIWL